MIFQRICRDAGVSVTCVPSGCAFGKFPEITHLYQQSTHPENSIFRKHQTRPQAMAHKRTLVVGATDNPERYAYKAATRLLAAGHPIELLGTKTGQVAGHPIRNGQPDLEDIDTVTLYVGTQNQPPLYGYLLDLHPKRIIFNPGTENPELRQMADDQGIETVEGCTLVMLATGGF